MAENDGTIKKVHTRTPGIVQVPLGSRGPRSLYLRRHGDSFGFRIRHFILYPPDSVSGDARQSIIGTLQEPMETIFVKELNEKAKEAGLQLGDKLIAVNNISVAEINYKQVVSLIYNSQEYLHLLVVPKEEDILQKFFSDAAHNPASNQANDPAINTRSFGQQKNAGKQSDFKKDTVSFRSLDGSLSDGKSFGHNKSYLEQRSADDLLHSQLQENSYSSSNSKTFSENYLDPTVSNDVYCRSRAQPQVPFSKKMGRRASEGNMLSDYEPVGRHHSNQNMGTPLKSSYLEEGIYSNPSNYRLSLDNTRRDSNASLTSSIAESSKDSLSSFNSISTLTGHETDDSSIINRIRRNVQQKEEFLRRSSNPFEKPIIQKEFYSRPNRLDKPVWPPLESAKSLQTTKPVHHNLQKIKNDIDLERNKLSHQNSNENYQSSNSPKLVQKEIVGFLKETSCSPNFLEGRLGYTESKNEQSNEKRNCVPQVQMVSKRTRQFETGQPILEDDIVQIDRTKFHKSELARLGAVHAIPNVNCRAREFENLVESKKDESLVSVGAEKCLKESLAADNLGNTNDKSANKVSGNVLTIVGGKNLHCSPPIDFNGSEVNADKPTVIRRPKNIHIDEEERAMRRESYLKATEGGRVNFDNEFDISSRIIKTSNGELLGEMVKTNDKELQTKRENFHQKLLEVDEKNSLSSSQVAEPQCTPASTSIQEGSQLSPHLTTKSKIQSTFRTRSPTGQSPVSKSRKSSQIPEPVFVSPKIKTWRGRVAKQFKKIHQGTSSPSSPTAPEGSTFGLPLSYCLPSLTNQYVPRLVEICTKIVESKGLDTIGIYRVPGNNAAVTALTEEVNRNYEDIPQLDPRWSDIHVVSSLLKSYFRKIPDSLLTNAAYPSFIQADKIDDQKTRMERIKSIIKNLPPYHYHTLKHLMLHLKKVVQHSDFNKMESRNLAIVFGPTLVRAGEDNMEMMVNDMTHQCKIVESLLNYVDWFFIEEDVNTWKHAGGKQESCVVEDADSITKQTLLRENICKMEAMKDQKKEFIQNLLSAAQRKVIRKKAKHGRSFDHSKEEPTSPFKELTSEVYSSQDSSVKKPMDQPTTSTRIDKAQSSERVPWFNYNTDKEEVQKRIANFIKETENNLQRSRNIEIKLPTHTSTSSGSLLGKVPNRILPVKTQSASNIFARTSNFGIQSNNRDKGTLKSDTRFNEQSWIGEEYKVSDNEINFKCDSENFHKFVRKGSSERNLNIGVDFDTCTNAIKEKYKTDADSTKLSGSLDSLNKLQDNLGSDLLAEMTQLLDEKTRSLQLSKEQFLHGPKPPEATDTATKDLPTSPKSFRNPSLHKNSFSNDKSLLLDDSDLKFSEISECEKDKDEANELESIPDNEKYISSEEKLNFNLNQKSLTGIPTHSKLKRSESLNRSERSYSTSSKKQDFSKLNDRRRSDNLSKMEKTESNISKRREFSVSFNKRSQKEFTKLKRKNGMPERSIKRRHTVGGTKDPDKISWLDNRYHKKVDTLISNKNEKPLRISSPDLRSTRKEKLLFEVTVFRSEDMIVQFRQRVLSTRPQSYPEAYKVALESHV